MSFAQISLAFQNADVVVAVLLVVVVFVLVLGAIDVVVGSSLSTGQTCSNVRVHESPTLGMHHTGAEDSTTNRCRRNKNVGPRFSTSRD